jgi:hypothetical protein
MMFSNSLNLWVKWQIKSPSARCQSTKKVLNIRPLSRDIFASNATATTSLLLFTLLTNKIGNPLEHACLTRKAYALPSKKFLKQQPIPQH